MFGIKFMKLDPTIYAIHYQNGAIKKEGPGLTFIYWEPTANIVGVPINTIDLPFTFQEVTADFQLIAVQGQLTYRVVDPKRLAGLLNFKVNDRGRHVTEDPTCLGERLINATQNAARALVQRMRLKEVLANAGDLADQLLGNLRNAELMTTHGLEILGLNIVALRPTPETMKALEAEAREALLRKADQAIYARRNAAVEEERRIRENELETDRAVEERKRAVREAQMEAEIAVEEKKRLVRETQVRADIAVENQRVHYIEQKVENDKKEADAKAYALEKTLRPVQDLDWRKLAVLGQGGLDAKFMIAEAFDRLAQNAQKIGQLNVTPDLLNTLIAGHRE